MTLHDYQFRDRRHAGSQLADALMFLRDERPVVLALPRGGVPVAFEVAHALGAPLDVLLVRKIGAPGYPELGLGAVVGGRPHQLFLNEKLVDRVNPPHEYLLAEEQRQLAVIDQRRELYACDRPHVSVQGRTVVVVDDGIATGGTMRVALRALAAEGVARLLFATPVAPADVLESLGAEADDGICLIAPDDFHAVGRYYANFEQTTDEEVICFLHAAAQMCAV